MPERFYQRALSADADELSRCAAYLKHDSLAATRFRAVAGCPSPRSGAPDDQSRTQLSRFQTIVSVIAAISAAGGSRRRSSCDLIK